MHISCSYDMSYVITFDIWEVRILSYYFIIEKPAYVIYKEVFYFKMLLIYFEIYTSLKLQNDFNNFL